MLTKWKRLLNIVSLSQPSFLDVKPGPPVLVNGVRIWLKEIEAMLNDQPEVRQSYVRVVDADSPAARLIAYVIPSEDGIDPRSMMSRMKHILPMHLLPEQFVLVDDIPLTKNGLVDKDRLPVPAPLQREGTVSESRGERFLLKLWKELLANDEVGPEDDFFALGGTEESAKKMLSRIEDSTGLSVSIDQLRAHSVLRSLARMLDEARPAASESAFIELRAGESKPIFLIPAAARTSLSAMRYVTRLRRGVRVTGVEYPRDLPPLPPQQRLHALAEYFVSQIRSIQPHGPYSLIGNCMGGVLVFEIASQLQREGESLEHAILIDCDAPKMQEISHDRGPLHYLRRLAFLLEKGAFLKTILVRFRRKILKPAKQRLNVSDDIRRGIKYLWDAKTAYRAEAPQEGHMLVILNSLSRETDRVVNWKTMAPNAEICFVEDTGHIDLFHTNSALDNVGSLINSYLERKRRD